jgi:putative Holliday junction resolvase
MSNYLGIDYGSRHVGLAIADAKLKIALPHRELDTKIFFVELPKIVKDNDIVQIVVGLPVSLTNTITPQTVSTQKFIERLKRAVSIPVVAFDERLTSKLVKGLPGSDHIQAARLILEDYLNKSLT